MPGKPGDYSGTCPTCGAYNEGEDGEYYKRSDSVWGDRMLSQMQPAIRYCKHKGWFSNCTNVICNNCGYNGYCSTHAR